jgi:predicted transcriptional regulator
VDTLVLIRRRKDNLRVLQTIQRYGTDLGETVIPMDVTGRIALGTAVSELRQAEVRAKVREVLEKLAEGESLDLRGLREQTEMDRNSVHRAAKELVDEGVVERIGEGKPGNPWRYLMAGQDPERTVLLYSSTSKPIQQYSNTEAGEPLCRACGEPLSEAEAQVSFQLHWGCRMPLKEG